MYIISTNINGVAIKLSSIIYNGCEEVNNNIAKEAKVDNMIYNQMFIISSQLKIHAYIQREKYDIKEDKNDNS